MRVVGFDTIRTGALGVQAGARFERLGFESVQSLMLLEHTSLGSVPTSRVETERLSARRRHCTPVASTSLRSDPAGAIDRVGIGDVRSATPRHRARIVRASDEIVAYAISGRDGSTGYLQRLAVDPAHHQHGHGTALVVDALRWMARWRVQRALVNTHIDNNAALGLYHAVGFTDLTERLHVYERRIE